MRHIKEVRRKYYLKNKAAWHDYYVMHKDKWEKKAHMGRKAYDEYKVERGCAICGNKSLPPECYDFHHIDPKEKERDMGRSYLLPMAVLEKEMAKCIVVCANCHRQLTHGRIDINGNKIQRNEP